MESTLDKPEFKLVVFYDTPVLSVVCLVILQLLDPFLHHIIHILLLLRTTPYLDWASSLFTIKRLPIIVVFPENLKLVLVLCEPPLSFLMQILLKEHDQSESINNVKLFLFLSELFLLLLLLPLHGLCAKCHLLDAMLHLEQLLKFIVVLRHERVRLLFFDWELVRLHFHKSVAFLGFVGQTPMPRTQSIEGYYSTTLL